MSESAGYCLIKCESTEKRDRFIHYLNIEARPDFADEVPAADHEWFAIIDGFPEPESIEVASDTTLFIYFEYEAEEAKEGFLDLFAIEKPASCIFLEFYDGVATAFERYTPQKGGYFAMLYCQELEGEVDSSVEPAWLSAEKIEQLKEKTEGSYLEGMKYLADLD